MPVRRFRKSGVIEVLLLRLVRSSNMFKFNFSDIELEDDPQGGLEPASQPIGVGISEQPEENKPENRNESGHYGELDMDELVCYMRP